jgi:hypothetical protein
MGLKKQQNQKYDYLILFLKTLCVFSLQKIFPDLIGAQKTFEYR